jgi:hypothetical protein
MVYTHLGLGRAFSGFTSMGLSYSSFHVGFRDDDVYLWPERSGASRMRSKYDLMFVLTPSLQKVVVQLWFHSGRHLSLSSSALYNGFFFFVNLFSWIFCQIKNFNLVFNCTLITRFSAMKKVRTCVKVE